MTARIIEPTSRGFLFLDSHPAGCAQTVRDLWEQVPAADPHREPVALIVGSSAGYGLAATVAGLRRYGIKGVGVSYEKAPGRRTATAGWYRTVELDRLARAEGCDFTFLNADAFTDATKTDVLDLIAERYGPIDYFVYSVAAPRRTDPESGQTYTSAIKPIGAPYATKTLVFDEHADGVLKEIEVPPATDEEIHQTIQVMGGTDWARWIDAIANRDLLGAKFTTVALSYIGSHLTSDIYRDGTIGTAKMHLEATARDLDERLWDAVNGRAITSVNGAAVTQSSTAIPAIGLYVSLLRAVLGTEMVSPVEQLTDLWDRLTETSPLDLDEAGRVRLDDWELNPVVEHAVGARWENTEPGTVTDLADLTWFRQQVRQLYGFDVPGIDYTAPTEVDQPWPTPTPR